MTESPDRRSVAEERPQQSVTAAENWQAPTLTLLGNAVPLTMGAAGPSPDGPNLKS